MNQSNNILKRLSDLKWYNEKYIHKIEDTMFTFLTKQEMIDFYNQLTKETDIPNKIEEKHITLWNFKGNNIHYYRIALSNTYRENYLNI